MAHSTALGPAGPPDPARRHGSSGQGTSAHDVSLHEVSLHEARMRLAQLVRMTAVADQVTVIIDAGRPVAALVPAEAAQTCAQARASVAHARATAAGWMQRLETVRDGLCRQHASQQRELQRALSEAWRQLDRVSPPGAERGVDTLRAAHRHILADGDAPPVP